MHEHQAQQAVAQMPDVMRPHAFGSSWLHQLPKKRINAIEHPAQHRTPTVRWLILGAAKGGQQEHSRVPQSLLE